MSKVFIGFIAGCCCAVLAMMAFSLFRVRQANRLPLSSRGTASATVTLWVAEDPRPTVAGGDWSTIIDRVQGLTAAERQFVRDGIALGLITDVQLVSQADRGSRFITVPADSSGLLIRGSTKANFGAPVLVPVQKPDKAPEPIP